ncbi:ATP-binding cassette domain-containing protein [Olivibacter sp. CPCC 100613]|uniref:ABC transporter ATP-binding protein n=1 Tax=Olivibacter sp. CPCC 100613 TaxID=3079931 RepID=UPI002FF45029
MIEFNLRKTLHTAEGDRPLSIKTQIETGSFLSLYGVSGSGKTSILRMLAGFLKPDDGYIKVNDSIWLDTSIKYDLPSQRRRIGFVFQNYALFPHMNVHENISFGLNKKDPPKIVTELLDLTGLANLSKRKVQTLSGGQQQRVALARAIARKPSLLLLDEPLSAIDDEMRIQLQEMLLTVHKHFALTTILVSHNAEEIIRLSDKVIHLENGRVHEPVSPATLFLKETGNHRLTGTVVSLAEEGNFTVMIENRLLLMRDASQSYKIREKIEIIFDKGTWITKQS